jgi:hypothetical protein
LRRKFNSFFQQVRSVRFNRAAAGGGLTGEFGLNFGLDLNRD